MFIIQIENNILCLVDLLVKLMFFTRYSELQILSARHFENVQIIVLFFVY